jgi:flagellum-specific peptidoglycan hydrolase FlgJ
MKNVSIIIYLFLVSLICTSSITEKKTIVLEDNSYCPVYFPPTIPTIPKPRWTPTTRTERFIVKFAAYDSIFIAHNINPVTAITQAIIEQGAREMKGFRHFNLSYIQKDSTSLHTGYDKVWDNGRWRKYRTYDCLGQSITDYCKMLNKAKRYKKVFTDLDYKHQITEISKAGYAESPVYKQVLLKQAEYVNKIYQKTKL